MGIAWVVLSDRLCGGLKESAESLCAGDLNLCAIFCPPKKLEQDEKEDRKLKMNLTTACRRLRLDAEEKETNLRGRWKDVSRTWCTRESLYSDDWSWKRPTYAENGKVRSLKKRAIRNRRAQVVGLETPAARGRQVVASCCTTTAKSRIVL
jgi:hypothetical protein